MAARTAPLTQSLVVKRSAGWDMRRGVAIVMDRLAQSSFRPTSAVWLRLWVESVGRYDGRSPESPKCCHILTFFRNSYRKAAEKPVENVGDKRALCLQTDVATVISNSRA